MQENTARQIEPEETKADSLVIKSQAKVELFKDKVRDMITVNPDKTFLVTVTNAEQFSLAQDVVKLVDEERKTVYNDGNELCKKAHELHTSLVAKRDAAVAPYDTLKKALVAGGNIYRIAEQKKADEEAARLREIARKEEEERRLAEAEALEREGRTEEAEEIISAPITYVAPTPIYEAPKADKRIFRDPVLKGRIKDPKAFYQYVAARPELYDLITVNEGNLNRKIKALGKAFNMPGVELYEV
jgi:hypothetical protein